MEKRAKNGEIILLRIRNNTIVVWHQRGVHLFCLEINGKVVLATKTWLPIELKIKTIDDFDRR